LYENIKLSWLTIAHYALCQKLFLKDAMEYAEGSVAKERLKVQQQR